MRRLAALLALLVFAACPADTALNPPPATRFFFPTGLVHVDAPGSDAGFLFVANANWNRLYGSGSISAVDLDHVPGLPAFGAPVDGGPRELKDLGGPRTIQVNSFTGELAPLALAPGKVRLFVPSRSEGMKFQAVDAVFADGGVDLACFPAAPAATPRDCGANAPSLTPVAFEQTAAGVPRASSPYGVTVQRRACSSAPGAPDACGADAGRTCDGTFCRTATGEAFADTWVTHLIQADSPIASGRNYRGYVVRVESDQMTVGQENFVNLGVGATSNVAAGRNWVYVTGRFVDAATYPYPIMLRYTRIDPAGLPWASASLETTFAAEDARGVAVSSDETRLYILTHVPDTLVVVRLSSLDGLFPTAQIIRTVPLPYLANEVVVIPRPGRGDLLAISCSGSSVLAIYDEDLGALAAQLTSVGDQPFGISYDLRGEGARLYVSNFGDGRVAVVDIPDLDRPQEARTVAHLGDQQLCLIQVTPTANCIGFTP